jgi:hypothetical protein
MILSVGSIRVYFGTIFGFRSFERGGLFPEAVAKLRPDYTESLDELLQRMTAWPGGAINDAFDAEWRSRTEPDNEGWLQQCRKSRLALLEISSL